MSKYFNHLSRITKYHVLQLILFVDENVVGDLVFSVLQFCDKFIKYNASKEKIVWWAPCQGKYYYNYWECEKLKKLHLKFTPFAWRLSLKYATFYLTETLSVSLLVHQIKVN